MDGTGSVFEPEDREKLNKENFEILLFLESLDH